MKLSEPEGDVTFDQIIVDFRERWGRAKRGGTRDVWAIVLARLRRDRIAIEAEARAAVLRELREEVAGIPNDHPSHVTDCIRRRSVLAAIDRRLGG